MKKRILLIGYNFYPEPTGIGKYSGEMIYWLARQGYDCTVITTYPYYPYWQVQEPYARNRFWYTTENEQFASGGQLRICRCPMYVPTQPSGLKRILLDFSFLVSAGGKLLHLLLGSKYDAVVVVAPSFQFGLLGVLYQKLRNGRFFYHIQDLQIEAARDLQMIKSKKVIELLLKTEGYILKQADVISSISEGMVGRIQAKAQKPVVLFPNWTDLTLFYPIADKAPLKMEFGFSSTDRIVLYSGAMGEKQGLDAILYAAQEYRQQPHLKFIICGSGPYKATLEALAHSLALTNVVFLPLQAPEKLNHFLNMADVHLVIQKATASDLVMPSKLTTILAVGGLALITANEGSGLHNLVQQHGIGLLVEAESQSALSQGLQRALAQDNRAVTTKARKYADQYLSLECIMATFEEALLH
ncbi:WcaI family glycosyltransferase [Hymenobacter sp. BT188]|uniref:WcaI family glycosyltransferase n=1 Tax=Hymenobacter sp. BT188 TaxID=2763504 RepID=UPI00165183A7|nr:WcaI family glycosyltransferase [Hymenobacter sp. BT188]MBC6608752.1 WcaI family glycosyltransferase [Hymenobacter sp. BT188]